MGRQWLLAKREVASLRKSQATGKYLKEIMVAAKHGGADPSANARLFAACEKARKESGEARGKEASGKIGEWQRLAAAVVEAVIKADVKAFIKTLGPGG